MIRTEQAPQALSALLPKADQTTKQPQRGGDSFQAVLDASTPADPDMQNPEEVSGEGAAALDTQDAADLGKTTEVSDNNQKDEPLDGVYPEDDGADTDFDSLEALSVIGDNAPTKEVAANLRSSLPDDAQILPEKGPGATAPLRTEDAVLDVDSLPQENETVGWSVAGNTVTQSTAGNVSQAGQLASKEPDPKQISASVGQLQQGKQGAATTAMGGINMSRAGEMALSSLPGSTFGGQTESAKAASGSQPAPPVTASAAVASNLGAAAGAVQEGKMPQLPQAALVSNGGVGISAVQTAQPVLTPSQMTEMASQLDVPLSDKGFSSNTVAPSAERLSQLGHSGLMQGSTQPAGMRAGTGVQGVTPAAGVDMAPAAGAQTSQVSTTMVSQTAYFAPPPAPSPAKPSVAVPSMAGAAVTDLAGSLVSGAEPLSRGIDPMMLPQMLAEASVRAGSASYRQEMPRLVATQLAEAVASRGQRKVDVVLSPRELGHVTMRLATTETGVMLMIQAERPETEDLMRRHIHELAKEFKEMGFSDIEFDFGDGSSRAQQEQGLASGQGTDSDFDGDAVDANEADNADLMIGQLNLAAEGLDVRV